MAEIEWESDTQGGIRRHWIIGDYSTIYIERVGRAWKIVNDVDSGMQLDAPYTPISPPIKTLKEAKALFITLEALGVGRG